MISLNCTEKKSNYQSRIPSLAKKKVSVEFGEGKVQTIFKVEEEQNNPSISNNEEKWEKNNHAE